MDYKIYLAAFCSTCSDDFASRDGVSPGKRVVQKSPKTCSLFLPFSPGCVILAEIVLISDCGGGPLVVEN